MPRSVNHVASRNRRKKILSLTRGNFGGRANVWTVAKNTWEKGLQYAYRDRKNKKRTLCRSRPEPRRAALPAAQECVLFLFYMNQMKQVNAKSRGFAGKNERTHFVPIKTGSAGRCF